MAQTSDDLLSRLQSATGPSRELDAEIALANGWKHYVPCDGDNPDLDYWRSPTGQICPNVPRYTESIDAALTLVPEDWDWEVSARFARVWRPDDIIRPTRGQSSATPAIALLIAIEKAQEDSKLAGKAL